MLFNRANRKWRIGVLSLFLLALSPISLSAKDRATGSAGTGHIFNRRPLAQKPYAELALGSIEPEGWMKVQLETMAKGMTGHFDELYPEVVGQRNGWLGGDGDGWERGPYWIDGLLPLAYMLKDDELIAKVRPWVEWTLNNQRADGYIGPIPFEEPVKKEVGLQRDKRRDWWPKMVMLKILMQYYSATGDERVIDCMSGYFGYQLKHLPDTPLGNWTYWGNRRGGDNLMAVLWLYNITGDKQLLKLAELIHDQTWPYTEEFLKGQQIPLHRPWRLQNSNETPGFHCVNLAQGIKEPVIYYQLDKDDKHLRAVDKAFADIHKYHGQPHGLYGGDEGMHGRRLTRGSELCTCIEMMYSLEKMLEITGRADYADKLEKLAYNTLPSQISDDFMKRQYFSQANQISATMGNRDFFNDKGDRVVFGFLEGYPCCTCNMHQGWPKFVQHLWLATQDEGLAALVYGPSRVTAKVAGGHEVTIRQATEYPFKETVRFEVSTERPVEFPLHFRVPGWCGQASVRINGQKYDMELRPGRIVKLRRMWRDGDVMELILPMELKCERWIQNSASVELGPLVMALKLDEKWIDKGSYREVVTGDKWNYALMESDIRSGFKNWTIDRAGKVSDKPWTFANAPITVKARGVLHPNWHKLGIQAGPVPWSPQGTAGTAKEIELIPYGCTSVRISGFPTVRK